MKKLLISSLSFIALAVLGTGCLKDKDIDNPERGIGTNDITSTAAVSFPAAGGTEVLSYGLISQATPYDLVGPHIALEGTGPLSSDVHVTLAVQDALVDSANAHDANLGLIVLPASEYALNLTRTIVAGQAYDSVVVTVNNLSGLDPNNTYAIGLTITSVDNGLNVIATQKSIVIQINIRNQYDGIYSVESGFVTRYLASGLPAGDALSGDLTGNPDVYLLTSGPTTCDIPPASASAGNLHWSAASGSIVAGIDGLHVMVNANNDVTVTSDALPGNLANWAGHQNTYDPMTQTFNLAFTWINTAGALREYEIVLKFKDVRP